MKKTPLPCPNCGARLRLHTSKRRPDGFIWRYRECERCLNPVKTVQPPEEIVKQRTDKKPRGFLTFGSSPLPVGEGVNRAA
jgi:hypothetical protein